MSDNLDSDDILRAIEAPSSEFDPNMDGVSDDGWGSNVNSEMDDTDEDPDFLHSDDSVPGSESDDNEVGIIESMDCSDEMIDSVIEDVIVSSESENVNIENVEREVVNIEGIDRQDFTVNPFTAGHFFTVPVKIAKEENRCCAFIYKKCCIFFIFH
ncbi:hypothetical protein J6590_106474 [Homalodisca vitripennis]|nr:hypothetical protein J6590_106474 [Homalodisca vitripennis]